MKKLIGMLALTAVSGTGIAATASDAIILLPSSFDASKTYLVAKDAHRTGVVDFSDAKECPRFTPLVSNGECISGSEAINRFGSMKPVVLKDTRQYAPTGGGPATIGGEYLVRQGDMCVKTTLRLLKTSLNIAPSIGTTTEDFRCDARGNPV